MEEARPHPRDYWPAALAAAHLAHTLWYASIYPEVVHDPDLLSYFIYFRNWITGNTALQDASYFTVPKPLLVFLLGPLDSPLAAFAVSALCAAALGALVYLVARQAFGRTVGILCSAALLVDVDRATLTTHANADFFLALFLYASIHAALVRRWTLSGIMLVLAALVKPVALPCVVHLLAVQGEDRRPARRAAALALVAIPLTLLANQALVGSPLGTQRFLANYNAMSDGVEMATGDIVRFVLWVELVKTSFVATAPLGVVGLLVWIGRDRRRLTHPFLLAPLALLGGYVALSVTMPFIAFARFFWPVQVWFGCFVVYGIVETARRMAPEPGRLRFAIAAVLLFFLFDEQMARQLRYRSHFAALFESTMRFVGTTDGLFANTRGTHDSILTPLEFYPYLLWTIDEARTNRSLVRLAELERWDGSDAPPNWVIYVPQAFLRPEVKARVETLLGSGLYRPIMADASGIGAIYMLRAPREPLARLDPSR